MITYVVSYTLMVEVTYKSANGKTTKTQFLTLLDRSWITQIGSTPTASASTQRIATYTTEYNVPASV